MKRQLILAGLLMTLGVGLSMAQSQAQTSGAPQQVEQRLTSASTIGALLADPRARPVMDRFLPNLAGNPHLDRIRDWPLRRLATDPHARGLTLERLAEIDAALAEAQRE